MVEVAVRSQAEADIGRPASETDQLASQQSGVRKQASGYQEVRYGQ